MTLLDPHAGEMPPIAMVGLEPDNLLGILALLGSLRALDTARPDWQARASWVGPPWQARLHLSGAFERREVARAANDGIAAVCAQFETGGHKNVDFTPEEYREYARGARSGVIGAALASALAAERPQKRAGGIIAAPLVMMFGQGWQNFLERLIDVPAGKLPNRLRKLRSPPDMRDPRKIEEALFEPWRREDDADGFRWDPEDDQRYALRFGDPSAAGAAPTVHGANRLAAIGFLSLASAPAERRTQAVGSIRDDGEWCFVWPIWSRPLCRAAVEKLLSHPDLLHGRLGRLLPLGVSEIFRARRVANGKFMNVTRAQPM